MNLQREKLKIFNRDSLKFTAIIIMFWGHLLAWLTLMRGGKLENMPLWQNLISNFALICPPVMFFSVADGYKYTRDRKKYALRLLIFACISQIPDWLVMQPVYGWWTSNVIFTLFFGLLSIVAWESDKKKWQKILLIVLCHAATVLIMSDWLIFGVLFILFIHIFRERPKARWISYTVIAAIWQIIAIISSGITDVKVWTDSLLRFAVVMLAYFCVTVLCSGKKGKHPVFSKWFFYIFYPLHYLIIFAVFKFISQ